MRSRSTLRLVEVHSGPLLVTGCDDDRSFLRQTAANVPVSVLLHADLAGVGDDEAAAGDGTSLRTAALDCLQATGGVLVELAARPRASAAPSTPPARRRRC
jgi:hypothetical protein